MQNAPVVSYRVAKETAYISIDNPPVNALSHTVRQGLMDALSRAAAEGVAVIVLGGARGLFIAGADIREIGQPPKDPQLPEVIEALDNSSIPIIASIEGHALGGGLEVALACHFRIASPKARFGLPEVKLGIIPGAGGTQRLPRAIGIQPALEMIATGNPIDADRALQMGLVDAVLEGDLQQLSPQWFQQNHGQHLQVTADPPRLSDRQLEPSDEDRKALEKARARAARKPQVLAPQRLCDAIEAAYTFSFSAGLARERTLFCECRDDPQSAAFRHLFFAEREAGKAPKGSASIRPNIHKVAVVGGGTMGRGIAISLLDAGCEVSILELSDERIEATKAALTEHYLAAVSKGRLDELEKSEKLRRLGFITSYDNLPDVELAIEAVFEDMETKKQVFRALDQACQPDTILASNTSFQDINLLAAETSRPENVLGMHYFSPANIMKLVEVVRGDATSASALSRVMSLAKRCSKIPVVSGVCYGFIGNRINRRLQQQAQLCLLEGATPAQVDGATQTFGMAMGPLAVSDLAGLDIGYSARKQLNDDQKGDPRTYWIPDRLVEDGRLGQKSGKGYFLYGTNSRKKSEDPAVLELIERASTHFSVNRRAIESIEIVERLILAVVNEAAQVLEEGIASRPGDIDVVYVNGYGFPAYKGGVLYWADQYGIAKACERLKFYAEQSADPALLPAKLIVDLARDKRNFHDLT